MSFSKFSSRTELLLQRGLKLNSNSKHVNQSDGNSYTETVLPCSIRPTADIVVQDSEKFDLTKPTT